jgi:hypothetical protein
MERRIAQPLKNYMIKAHFFTAKALENLPVSPHVHSTFGHPVDLLPTLKMRNTHPTRQVAMVGGFYLKNAAIFEIGTHCLSA